MENSKLTKQQSSYATQRKYFMYYYNYCDYELSRYQWGKISYV